MRSPVRIGWLLLGWIVCLAPAVSAAPLVVDHNAADHYNDIPQAYIDEVKKMWIVVAGESHSAAYRSGCLMLETLDPRFQVQNTESGTPEGPTSAHLRISRATWGDVDNASGWIYGYGEEDWYTSAAAVQRTQDGLTYCNAQGLTPTAFGFGWCWDMTWNNAPGGGLDPVLQVRWAGSSVGGPQGNLRWGLDAADQALTGNSVCLDTYLGATQQYIAHCQSNSYPTRVFYTTGPVDGAENTGESGYQRHLKCERIRAAVDATADGVLFDYADILCWSNAGVEETTVWTDGASTTHTYPTIHPDNLLLLDGSTQGGPGHIGERGALRLGKAVWWMLARMAGWDGLPAAGTATATLTPSATRTRTATRTVTATPTISRTATATPTRTASPTQSATRTVTRTATATPTVSVTASITPTNTMTPIVSATPTPTGTLPQDGRAVLAYPNPAHDQVSFVIRGPEAGEIKIAIFNASGERVANLVSPIRMPVAVVWDCRGLARGLYFARVTHNGKQVGTCKVSLAR